MSNATTKLDREGMERACDVSQWNLGDASWAYMIVEAYLAETDDVLEAREGLRGE